MEFESLISKGIGDLQKSIERFETYNDSFILPDHYIVVRLDAHRLGDWGLPKSEYPCGQKATAAFHQTAVGLMTSTFRVVLAYHHGDEISLLLDPSENNSPLRRSKLISAFASAAAVSMIQSSGLPALFDAKVSELPSPERVLEYFLWQRRYCFRNALTIALRTALIAQGFSPEQAEREIHGVSEEARLQKLNALNAPITKVPATTRRGTLLRWERLRQDGREHFRIHAERALPDDDREFVAIVASVLEAYQTRRETTRRPKQKEAQPAPRDTEQSSSKNQKQHQKETPPSNADAPHKRGNTKSNTSVFKVAGNS